MGFVFMHGLLGKLLVLTGALLRFLNITQTACIFNGQERCCSKINPADQFDHVSFKKRMQKGY